MKLKQYHILEAIVVILILSILIYTIVPKAINSQHRAQIAQLEAAMDAIKNYLIEHPNDNSIIRNNILAISVFFAGPHYNQREQKGVLLYYYREVANLNIKKLEEFFPEIHFPDWTLSELEIHGYDVHPKKSSKHTMKDGYTDFPVYVALVARVGDIDEFNYMRMPYSAGIDDHGNFKFSTHITAFDVTNGLSRFGEFFVDTADVWEATPAVLLEKPVDGDNPVWWKGN